MRTGEADGLPHRAAALAAELAERTGRPTEGVWAAPGRVNVIGEHTDYNEGFALPIAIDRIALAAIRRRADRTVRCWSVQDDQHAEVSLDEIGPGHAPAGWAAYPAGVAWALEQSGTRTPGFDLLIDSTVPVGAGMSSSAALQCAVALALSDLTGAHLDRQDLALAGQRAENDIVGAPTGFLDQMAAMLATENRALFLDCRTRATEQVPFDLGAAGAGLLVVDTRSSHAHADGGYRERREACERAARALGVRALRDIDAETLAGHRHELDEQTFRRARHVVTEDERVLRTVDLLRGGNLDAVGRQLLASHTSMREDFEISTPELDTAVDAALSVGALGARMTGGGFGGSAIVLAQRARWSAVDSAVRTMFAAAGFTEPSIFAVTASPGARRVS